MTQPIPSTARDYPVFLPNKGPVLDKPKEFLQDSISPYSRNMELLNEMIQGRRGLAKLLTTVLSGYVLAQPKLRAFNNTKYNLFCTSKDIYSLDYSNSRYDILTPTYTTGTIEIQAGTPTILRGSGTLWDANAKAGDFIKIGAGSVHTDSTWYEIESVDSDTLITLTASGPTTGAGASYVLRQIFSGGNTYFWDWEQFLDDNLGEVVIMTNGVDTPVYWDGAGAVVAMGTLATGFTAAKYVDVYKDRILFLDTVEGGARQPQRERWSGVADLTDWTDIDFADFVDEPTFITGTARFAGYHIVFKETNAYVGRHVGSTEVFDYDLASECEGCRARFSIIEHKEFLAYYGSDKKFHKWNLLQDQIISESIFPETKEFDPNTDKYITAGQIKRKNHIRWHCPYGDADKHNYTVVWDYSVTDRFEIKIWQYAEEDATLSFGSFVLTSDVYADDAIFGALYADETLGFADDSSLLSDAEITLYGGYDGIVRIVDSGTDDNGSTYNRLLRFKRFNLGLYNRRKRLQSQTWWLEQASSGTVTIKMRLDDSTDYHTTTKVITLLGSPASKEITKQNIVWDLHAVTFQPEISATNHFSLEGFVNYYYIGGFASGA